MLNIRDFGAVADGKTVNTKAIQAAVDRAGETGETVLVPGGVFITGTIHLNGASLHLEPGAVLKGSTNIDDYPAQDFIHNEMGVLRALLINRDHDNVTIDGSGTIDLSGTSFYDTSVMNVPSSRKPNAHTPSARARASASSSTMRRMLLCAALRLSTRRAGRSASTRARM